MPSRALAVATAAGLLLVAVVAVDASMNRVYHLEAQLEGRWIKVASSSTEWAYPERSLVPFEVNASDDVPFRVRAHNGYPWALSKDVEVAVDGASVFSGTLAAPAFGDAQEAFSVNASRLASPPGHAARGPVPESDRFWSPGFVLRVGDDAYHGSLAFREVAR